MGTTSVPAGSALANKQYSKALSAMAVRQPTPLTALTGPLPSEDEAMKKIRQQTTTEMPVVRVDELASGPGDLVQIDCAHVVKLRAVMGDRNAEGKGATLKYSSQEIRIDMATLPVSAGGKMTQKRTPHDMRKNALAQLKGGIPRFRWQRSLAFMAGARGVQDGTDWVLPKATDPEFAEQMVNKLQAPTYNRHFVVDGGGLVQGGAQLANIDTTDKLVLSCLDELAALWEEMGIKMAPIQIPGDPAAGDDPIKGILLIDPLVWDGLLTDTTASGNVRMYQAQAVERARYGKLREHPLFAGSPMFWNGILIRKGQFGIRFNSSDVLKHVTAANRLAATETDVTVNAALGATHQVSRSVFMGAQALGLASGGNRTSGETYSLLENGTNFNRNLELAGEIMGAEQKLRFDLPNADGELEATDFGALVIDSVVKKRNV